MNLTILWLILYIIINCFFYAYGFQIWIYPFTGLFFLLGYIYYEAERKRLLSHIENTQPSPLYPNQDYENELNTARNVQQGLLSVSPPKFTDIKIAKRCIPAASIGGDFYCFISHEGTTLMPKARHMPGVIEYIDARHNYLGLIIGDVAGHGVSSALVMALASGLLAEIGQTQKDPAKTLQAANNEILKYIQNSQISHVTAGLAFINTETKKMTYANAGHPPALLIRKDNTFELLEIEGLFLGMFQDETYQELDIQLQPGDRIFFYTDGITEAKNKHHEIFGMNRFKNLILAHYQNSIYDLMDIIYAEVNQFLDGDEIQDDQTMVIIEIE